VAAAVAALEAHYNEILLNYMSPLRASMHPSLFDRLWRRMERGDSLLEKYNFMLQLLGKPPLPKGASSYQDVVALIKLRNALIHYKYEWSDQQTTHNELSTTLQSYLNPSPIVPPKGTLFPDYWMSHECTTWAVKSCVAFAKLFDAQAGLPFAFSGIELYLAPY
jgi:hypothetical protein